MRSLLVLRVFIATRLDSITSSEVKRMPKSLINFNKSMH
ncbi:MAG: hypothetical protein MjAS7_1267 [Metallosphaera javensis (ex Sakai et al. 2022)]|nr:MAG: hypothetical protein MjAS7_1267 [Metallosphaera javensis (ex Sakai et al. 2022)]